MIRKRLFGLFSLLSAVMVLGFLSNTARAQKPGYIPIRGAGEPTAGIVDIHRGIGAYSSWFQPFRFNVPDGVKVAVAEEGRFFEGKAPFVYGLQTDSMYRLRISSIPLHNGKEIYPTIEIVNRLYSPVGKEFEFPVVVDITKEDIEYALNGALVTRVIYLERPETAIPIDSTAPGGKYSVDINDASDPLQVAEQYGPIMAILRMGSRIPLEPPNASSPFFFGLPPFTTLER
ncbi:MAG: hypothetical protein Q4G69_07660 [Planctomycetia bacterium]|nr:hypothetical protein [Planctomycetia bacterium]